MHGKNHLAPALEELDRLSGVNPNEYCWKSTEAVIAFGEAYKKEAIKPVMNAVRDYIEKKKLPEDAKNNTLAAVNDIMKDASIYFSDGGRQINFMYIDDMESDVLKNMSEKDNHIMAIAPVLHNFLSAHGVKRKVCVKSTSGYEASFDSGKPFGSS
jgi:hypothetical protein